MLHQRVGPEQEIGFRKTAPVWATDALWWHVFRSPGRCDRCNERLEDLFSDYISQSLPGRNGGKPRSLCFGRRNNRITGVFCMTEVRK